MSPMTTKASPPKVLIIEDDAIVGHIYRSRLEREGYAVELAADGQSGFFAIQTGRPDGVLLDLMLPKMNGLDVLRKIRAQAEFKNLPVIVFTNAYVGTMVKEALQAGASAVYDKATLTPRQIADSLNAFLQLRPQPNVSTPTAPTAASSAPAPASAAVTAPPAKVAAGPAKEDSSGAASDLAKDFLLQAPEQFATLRQWLQDLSRAADEGAQQKALSELYRLVHGLTAKAGLAELRPMAQVASALEALLRELMEKASNITPSTLRTVANTIDLLKDLSVPGLRADLTTVPCIRILVVDDDLLARRAVTFALQKYFEKPETAETGETALALAARQPFDVIFLDVEMPGMDGFTLCTKIRATPINSVTPVVFVTRQADFHARAQSTLSGGSDLIGKPFLFIEITVKALTFALRGRLQKMKAPPG